jgi:hypothetical protein
MFDNSAHHDFQRAMNRAAWRKILSGLTGSDNQLLPYDEVRARLPMRGQHYSGLHQVPIEKIVGSIGRYNDFDRAFLPIQNRTKDRWISIDKAHYEDIPLPPIELFKIGEIYFVKDGNHRVSVARERGQLFIDAYVTQIDIPITISADIKLDDLEKKEKQAEFYLKTDIRNLRPAADIELSNSSLYPVLLEHIATHRWYMGVDRKAEISEDEAVASWFDHVYLPLIEEIREQNLSKSFPGNSEADLYLWIVEYEKYLRQAYSIEEQDQELAKAMAARQLIQDFPESDIARLIRLVNRTNWLEKIILSQEQALFFEQTHILDFRPDVKIETTIPGKYDRLRDHIATHRWYLGEHRGTDVPYEDAVTSWYDHVYYPIVQVIREQDVLRQFPNRTETDLYLWIVQRQWFLRETYGEDIPIEQAAEDVTELMAKETSVSSVKKVVQEIKKVIQKKG